MKGSEANRFEDSLQQAAQGTRVDRELTPLVYLSQMVSRTTTPPAPPQQLLPGRQRFLAEASRMRSVQQRRPVGLGWAVNWGRLAGALAAFVVVALVVGIGQATAVSQEGSPLFSLKQLFGEHLRLAGQPTEIEVGRGMSAPSLGFDGVVGRAHQASPALNPERSVALGQAFPGISPETPLTGLTQVLARMQSQYRLLVGQALCAAGPSGEWEPLAIRLRDRDRDGSGDGQTASYQVGRQSRGDTVGRVNPDRAVSRGHDLHAGGQASAGGSDVPHGSADIGSPGNGGLEGGDQGNTGGSDPGGSQGGQPTSGGGSRSPSTHGGSGGNSQHSGGSGHGGH